MKRLLAVSLLVLLPACDWFAGDTKTITGTGRTGKRIVEIKNVKELKAMGAGKIFLKQGKEESLIIQADDNLLPYIVAKVEDGELFLGPKSRTILRSKLGINYYLVVKDLDHIELAGAMELETRSLKTKKLEMELSGATKLKMRVDTIALTAEASGAAKLYIEGRAKKQTVEISGSMHYDAGSLQSESAQVNVSGASRVTIAVSKNLEVEASGVAVVSYKGNPKTDISSFGASSVNKVG